VATCDPQEVIFDDQLGEDHVGLCILYCPRTMSIVTPIWKWSFDQTILDKYRLRKHLIATHILHHDDVGTIGVKKKKSFHKRMQNDVDFEGSISKIEEKIKIKILTYKLGEKMSFEFHSCFAKCAKT
jgi:hypothetical protein